MAYLLGQQNDYWRRKNQRRALTGLPSSYQEERGAMDSLLGTAANKDIQEAQLRNQYNIQSRQLSMQEQAMRDASRAASISGAANLGQLGLSGYLGYKSLTKAPSALEMAQASYLKGMTPGAAALPSAAVPAAAGVGSSGLLAGGVGSGAPMASAAYPGIVGGTAVPGAVGGMSAVGAEAAGTGLLGTAGAVAGPAGLAAGAGQILGKPVSKMLGTHEKTTGDVMSIGGGAAAGFVVGGPVGAVLGAALGGLASIF